jgi:hypothetical protein
LQIEALLLLQAVERQTSQQLNGIIRRVAAR